VRQGLKAMLRLGSAWYDVAAQAKAITELGLDSRHFILCTDDSHSGTLINAGHMDRVLRHAIEQGLQPMPALQMMTLNTAEHFGVSNDVGQIGYPNRAPVSGRSMTEGLYNTDQTDSGPRRNRTGHQLTTFQGLGANSGLAVPETSRPMWRSKKAATFSTYSPGLEA
jgi:hypothetical protein